MKLNKILLGKDTPRIALLLIIAVLLAIYYLVFEPLIANNLSETITKKSAELAIMQKMANTIGNTNKISKSSILTTITSVKNSNKLTNAFTKIEIKDNIINIKVNKANYVSLANFIITLSDYQIFVDSIKISKDLSGLVNGSIKLTNSAL